MGIADMVKTVTKLLPEANFNRVSSEIKLRQALEKAIDEVILVEQLQQICYDSESDEYREYNLVSRTGKQGMDLGDIDDMMTVYHQWKRDTYDTTFRVFLEYEAFNFTLGAMCPTGITREVGLLLKVTKGGI